MQFVTLYTVVETVCLVAACFYLRGHRLNVWGMQRIYLAVVLATETTGTYFRHRQVNNLPLYNAFVVVECVAIGWMLYRFLQPLVARPLKPWLLGWFAVFAAVYLLEWTLDASSHRYVNHTIVLMSLVFAVACGCYFYRLLATIPYANIMHHAPFWWMCGTALDLLGGIGARLAQCPQDEYPRAVQLPIGEVIVLRGFLGGQYHHGEGIPHGEQFLITLLEDMGFIEMTIMDRPTSSKQIYRLTEKGRKRKLG